MLRKILAFQILFLNTRLLSFDLIQIMVSLVVYFVGTGLIIYLLMGAFASVCVAATFIWLINLIVNHSKRWYETVPVSRGFIVFNIYLTSLVLTLIVTRISNLGVIVNTCFIYLCQPELIPFIPARTTSLEGSIFFLLVAIITSAIGTTIVFLRNKSYRNSAFAVLFILVYSSLAIFKSFVELETPFSLMADIALLPQINEILLGLSLAALLIVPLSIYVGYRLYLTPPLIKAQVTRTSP